MKEIKRDVYLNKLISGDAQECLKSWILITFKPARVASLVLLRYILESAIGLASDTTKKSSLNP